MIEMSLRRVSSEKDVVVLGENWLRTASQVYEALGQGCPEGLQFFRRCKSAILMSLMMMMMMKMMMMMMMMMMIMMMMKTDDDDGDDDDGDDDDDDDDDECAIR